MISEFLYIDDAPADIRNATANGLSKSGIIRVTAEEPLSWDTRIKSVSENIDHIDGVILDWRLTEEANRTGADVGRSVKYSAEGLTQHLRFLATDKAIKDIPVVLCSANQGFKEYYRRDSTGHDLFDEVYHKSDFAENHNNVVRELSALAVSYKTLQQEKQRSWEAIFEKPKNIDIDVRLTSNVSLFLEKMVPHGLIGFLLKDVIKKPGILIDEAILAARLGVDKNLSSDWNKFLESNLNPYLKYTGLLSNGWDRWWADGLVQWWKSEIHSAHPQLRAAKQRVKLLKEKTGFQGLVPLEKFKFCTESEFWTVCVATKAPISTSEGLRVLVMNEQPWQDQQYVSLYAVLERINPESFILNPLEKDRLANLKKMLK